MALPLIGAIGTGARVFGTGVKVLGEVGGTAAKDLGGIIVSEIRSGARALGNATKSFATNTSAKATSAVANLKERGNGIVRAVSNKARNGVKNWLFKEDNEFVGPRQPNDLGNPSEGRGTVSNTPEGSNGQTTPPPQTEDLSEYAKKSELSTVATTGNYNDLNNKPLAAVAVSGDYNDLINKPDFSGNVTDKAEEEKKPEEDKSEKPDTKKNEKEKLTERLTKAMEKVSSAFETLKRGFSSAKDEVSSGEMGLYGILGGLVGARNGWNAVEDKEKKKAENAAKVASAKARYEKDVQGDTVAGVNLLDVRATMEKYGGDPSELDNAQGGANVLLKNGNRSFNDTRRIDDFAVANGFIASKNEDDGTDYINMSNDKVKKQRLTVEEMQELMLEDGRNRNKQNKTTKPTNKQANDVKKVGKGKTLTETLKEKFKDVDVETVSPKKGDIYDEESGVTINLNDVIKANKDIKVDTKNTTKIGDTDIKKSNISSLDTQTGNTLSNNAMNLEKSKEKSVTIVNDSSVKATSQNTSAFPSPITVKNSDTDIKYFNNRI